MHYTILFIIHFKLHYHAEKKEDKEERGTWCEDLNYKVSNSYMMYVVYVHISSTRKCIRIFLCPCLCLLRRINSKTKGLKLCMWIKCCVNSING
jgi:hypothetical protein